MSQIFTDRLVLPPSTLQSSCPS
uniref:Uncharacterized protein n=1 Tax=Arundo donax TaxID=35708 RepID=A0A0A8ZBZ9_ARUDO